MQTATELKHHESSEVRTNSVKPVHRRPAVDLIEELDHFVMQLEMPGVTTENLEVFVERNMLTVKGHAPGMSADGYERIAGDLRPRVYQRSFQLSDEIDREGIEAELKHGLLMLKFPKSKAAQRTHIAVKESWHRPLEFSL